jgi:hypothetical protein
VVAYLGAAFKLGELEAVVTRGKIQLTARPSPTWESYLWGGRRKVGQPPSWEGLGEKSTTLACAALHHGLR